MTTFPALLFDPETRRVRPTPNLATLERGRRGAGRAGRGGVEINAPGTTSIAVFADWPRLAPLRSSPATDCTVPRRSTPAGVPELPAVLYVTEVSHAAGKTYCFGGGLYIDPIFPPYDVKAIVTERAYHRCYGAAPEGQSPAAVGDRLLRHDRRHRPAATAG